VTECFRIFGPEAKAAIPDLARILNRQPMSLADSSAQHFAAKALSYLGRDAVPVLLAAVTNCQRSEDQWLIIDDMAHFGSYGISAKPAILKWSTDTNEWIRLGALDAYVGVETNYAARIAFAAKSALKDPSDMVRSDATAYLVFVVEEEKVALPLLLEAAEVPVWRAQTNAISTPRKREAERAALVPLLTQKLHDEDSLIRLYAVLGLGSLGGKEEIDVLNLSTNDPDSAVRDVVLRSLKRLDKNVWQGSRNP
jgi:hypothetical protein